MQSTIDSSTKKPLGVCGLGLYNLFTKVAILHGVGLSWDFSQFYESYNGYIEH